MSTITFLSTLLEKIADNIDSIKDDQNLTNVVNTVSRIGSYLIEKSMCSQLLKHVLSILNKVQSSNLIAAKNFYVEMNKYYCNKKICPEFKVGILSYFTPAVEFETLSLLKLCAEIENPSDLIKINAAVLVSCLPSACKENSNMYNKVNCILKHSFILSKGNPVVGYLSFMFNKAVRDCSETPNPLNLFSSNSAHLELVLPVPECFVSQEQKLFYVRLVVAAVVEWTAFEFHACADVAFLLAIFPAFYHQLLTLCENGDDNTLTMFQYISNNCDIAYLRGRVKDTIQNPLWKNLLQF